MKKILALFIAIILSAILFGCVGNSDSDGTRIYADGITFNMIGYTQEESEKYIENIPTEDGGILKIYHLKDDSGRICSKLLISRPAQV